MEIVSEAGKPVALDNFMTWYCEISFARIRVEINLLEPLKLGVSICGQDGILATFCI